MECYSCDGISELNFILTHHAVNPNDVIKNCVSFCCERCAPAVPLTDDPKENLERFLGMRHLEMIHGLQPPPTRSSCIKCPWYVKKNWTFSKHILIVNFSIYPSPCQSHCSYCYIQTRFCKTSEWLKNPYIAKLYENTFKTLTLAKKIGLTLTQQTKWNMLSGEITIHPYKKEFLDLVRGEKVCFYTNAFLFDEAIAQELHDNPLATINLSIDAGTPESWRKVKGVDNFRHVLDNLKAYRKASARAGQITLKYIVLPGVNDSDEDFWAFANIVKLLDVENICLSRDQRRTDKEFSPSGNKAWAFSDVVESAARLLAVCNFNGVIPDDFNSYTKYEQDRINLLADKLLECMR